MKRAKVLAGAVLGGVLLVGSAGLVAAQDPVPPSPTPLPGMSGMMGGDMSGMMGGDMSGMTGMDQMGDQHAACDAEGMQEMHAQHHPQG